MKKNTKTKTPQKSPSLRFSEFDGGWEEKRLGDVLSLKTRPIKMNDDTEYDLVTVKRRYGGIITRGKFKGKEVLVKSQFLLKENDFLISKRQIVHNACGLVPKELEGSIVSNEYSVFQPKENFDIEYFNYFVKLPKVSQSFYLSSIGVHIEKMLFKVEWWLNWKYKFPTLPEQKKIAAFLTAVDQKIEQLSRKKELLQQYKKGIMQKLFDSNRRGRRSATPTARRAPIYGARFRDENNKPYPDWEEKRLGDVGEFLKGKLISKSDLTENGKTECILYGELYTYYTETILNIRSSTNINPKNLTFSKKNDVIIPSSGETHIDIATASCIQKDDVALGGDINIIRTNQNGIFLSYYLNNHKKLDIARLAQGNAVVHLYATQLKSLPIPLPSLAEQNKIAGFLSIIDKKIEAVDEQIASTKNFKKGLLQQMFV